MIKKFFKKTKRNLQAGFSLLEMVMVLAIFAIITAIVTYNYGAFNNQMTLTNLSYEIAMQIREAQVYSLGSKGFGNKFDSQYGVYFKKGAGSFISFIDSNKDGICDGNSPGISCDACTNDTECQKIISLPRNMKIENFIGSSNDYIYITFKRPDTESIIHDDQNKIDSTVGIVIKSPDGQYKKVVVKPNGYISVEDYKP